jgi:hypothetical protein
MKISIFITMLVMVGVILFTMSLMTNEAESNYNVTINQTWVDSSDNTSTSKYDISGSVNQSIYEIKTEIEKVTSEEEGWLNRVGAGFTGIVSAVIFIPKTLFQSVSMAASLVMGIGTSIGVPAYILLTFIILLTVWAVLELINFFQNRVGA